MLMDNKKFYNQINQNRLFKTFKMILMFKWTLVCCGEEEWEDEDFSLFVQYRSHLHRPSSKSGLLCWPGNFMVPCSTSFKILFSRSKRHRHLVSWKKIYQVQYCVFMLINVVSSVLKFVDVSFHKSWSSL